MDHVGQLGASLLLLIAFVAAVYGLSKRYSIYSNWELSLGPNPDR